MFTLSIYFIVLHVYVEFVLIYRPHPVYINFCLQVHFEMSATRDCSHYLPPVSTTQGNLVAKFAAFVVDIGGKFAVGVVDTGGNFATGVVDTGGAP
jgi:hypothetical protein